MTLREFLSRHGRVCAYCGGTAEHRDHIIPKAMRRRHHIKDSDERYHVAACGPCNWRKATRRYAPPSWADRLGELPGRGWQVWSGGPHLEPVR